MTKHTVCPTVLAYRVFKVAEQRKVPVVMYDYYDSCELKHSNLNIYNWIKYLMFNFDWISSLL